MLTLETDELLAEFHPRGAALHRLVYKHLRRDLVMLCPDRNAPHHNCNTIVGPVANRIGKARFTLDGEDFALDANDGANTLHGGPQGLSEIEWEVANADNGTVHFTTELPDGHMGFPGPSRFDAIYRLEAGVLWTDYRATSTRSNVFSLAPHFYFNLDGSGDFNNHRLQVFADNYLPLDDALIPTGEIAPLTGTPLDFRQGKSMRDVVIDNNFCLDGTGIRKAAVLSAGGIEMELQTDCPGLQVFDARHFGRSHVALEPQGWPNAVNEPGFPAQRVEAGETYRALSAFGFFVVVA